MSDLVLFKSENFQGIECDFWKNSNDEIFTTREQIGRALEYINPSNAIRKIHERNFDRIDKFSRIAQVDLPFGGKQDVYLYNAKGVYEICRWSRQPKADVFMDWVWDLLEGIRKNELELVKRQLEESKPKLELYEQVINAENCMSMLMVSKALKLNGRNKLFRFLRSEGILMSGKEKHNMPYQQFVENGYFVVVIKTKIIEGKIVDIPVTLVTPRGLGYIFKRLEKSKKKDLLLKQAN